VLLHLYDAQSIVVLFSHCSTPTTAQYDPNSLKFNKYQSDGFVNIKEYMNVSKESNKESIRDEDREKIPRGESR
jgi:hypothetical protein